MLGRAVSSGVRPGTARIFYGSIVVAGAFLILFMAYGTQDAFGVLFPLSSAMPAAAFVGFALAPELPGLSVATRSP